VTHTSTTSSAASFGAWVPMSMFRNVTNWTEFKLLSGFVRDRPGRSIPEPAVDSVEATPTGFTPWVIGEGQTSCW
jgi:hypothetical protein